MFFFETLRTPGVITGATTPLRWSLILFSLRLSSMKEGPTFFWLAVV